MTLPRNQTKNTAHAQTKCSSFYFVFYGSLSHFHFRVLASESTFDFTFPLLHFYLSLLHTSWRVLGYFQICHQAFIAFEIGWYASGGTGLGYERHCLFGQQYSRFSCTTIIDTGWGFGGRAAGSGLHHSFGRPHHHHHWMAIGFVLFLGLHFPPPAIGEDLGTAAHKDGVSLRIYGIMSHDVMGSGRTIGSTG